MLFVNTSIAPLLILLNNPTFSHKELTQINKRRKKKNNKNERRGWR